MRTFDPTPFWRSTVGFDHLFDLLEQVSRGNGEDNYPPCNIERTGENGYQICLALAGFTPDEIAITVEESLLKVEGSKPQQKESAFLYRGISNRPFRRMFNLAEYVQVKGATFENGLLKIELVREIPEAMKPRRIAINSGPPKVGQLKAA